MKRLYIAATEQHAGKTSLSVGLYRAAVERGYRTCFIKPVGQRYVMEQGQKVDEDAVLFKRAFSADGRIKMLNPITIPRGFTREYIYNRNPETIHRPILDAIESLEEGHDLAIVEGTGHAGVGSVVDASNAQVAKLLHAQCVIITSGGIGSSIDQLCLNRALFEQLDVPVVGAVVNKIYEEKYDKVSGALRQGLKNLGINCVGLIPYRRELTYPTMANIQQEMGVKLINGDKLLSNTVRNIIVAAMAPQNMLNYLGEGSLVVVPGDRVDNIITSVAAHLVQQDGDAPEIAGLLLTGDLVPHESVLKILRKVNVPVLVTDQDTATADFHVRTLVPKLTARDEAKIALVESVMREYADMDTIFGAIGLPDTAPAE
jgi:BioD-like phosphotransacetylase family protein